MPQQHTPGPWHTGTINLGDPEKGLYDRVVHNAAGYALAVAIKENQQANARLISAAPDLLKSLQSIIQHWRDTDEAAFGSDMATDAIESIRKAMGGTYRV